MSQSVGRGTLGFASGGDLGVVGSSRAWDSVGGEVPLGFSPPLPLFLPSFTCTHPLFLKYINKSLRKFFA